MDETYARVNGRWCHLWRAVDQCGQLIDFRLTARKNASAARAFMRQASETARCYYPLTVVTDKAHTYAKVIEEMNFGNGPGDRIRHLDQKHLNNRIEADHVALKQILGPKRNFRQFAAAKNTLKDIETHRAIKKGHFANNEPGIMNEIAFVAKLFNLSA
ncbi:MAG: DDE-type integrase/transposase/recombinase [Paracoccaceae bacterium]